MNSNPEREAFERYMRKKHGNIHLTKATHSLMTYMTADAEAFWELWQAALPAQPSAQQEVESDGDMYGRLGIDGRLWAEEMEKRFKIPMDELLPWTCSMIMASYDKQQLRIDAMQKQPSAPAGALTEEVREAIWQVLDDMDCFDYPEGVDDTVLKDNSTNKNSSCCIAARDQLIDAYRALIAAMAKKAQPSGGRDD